VAIKKTQPKKEEHPEQDREKEGGGAMTVRKRGDGRGGGGQAGLRLGPGIERKEENGEREEEAQVRGGPKRVGKKPCKHRRGGPVLVCCNGFVRYSLHRERHLGKQAPYQDEGSNLSFWGGLSVEGKGAPKKRLSSV